MKTFFAGLALASLLIPSACHAVLNDAIAYWAFDESSGNPVDSSGNGKTLTNNNTTPFVAAKINNGADLESGSTQSFQLSQSTYFDGTSGTASCWFKGESSKIHTFYSTVTNVGAGGLNFQVRDANTVFIFFGAGNQVANGSTALTVDGTTWYMVTATWSTLRKEVFLNASSDGANETDETMTAGSTNLYVGKEAVAGDKDFVDGVMDECAFYNRVLSGAEITSLYNSGSGTNPYFVPSPARPNDMIIFGVGNWVWYNGVRGPIPPRFSSPHIWSA